MGSLITRLSGSRPFLIACSFILVAVVLLAKDPFPCEPNLKSNALLQVEDRAAPIECPQLEEKECAQQSRVEIVEKLVEKQCPICPSQTPASAVVAVPSQTAASTVVICASQTPRSTAIVCQSCAACPSARACPVPASPPPCPQSAAAPINGNTYTVRWIWPSDEVFEENAPARMPPGCPPKPELCRFHHVFSEVLIVSSPKRRSKWLRLSQQLRKRGIEHSIVHGYEGHSPSFTRIFQAGGDKLMKNGWSLRWKVTELALLASQIEILEYLLRSPYQNVLVLEDDALLLAGDAFDIEFDRQMRLVRPDWTQLFLGATIDSWTDNRILWDNAAFWAMERSKDLRPFPVRTIYGTFAVAWHRSVAQRIIDLHTNMNLPLDNMGMHRVAQEQAERSLVFWPFLIAPDTRETTMQTMDAAKKASYARCRWNFSEFDLSETDSSGPFPVSVLGSAALEGGWGRTARSLSGAPAVGPIASEDW